MIIPNCQCCNLQLNNIITDNHSHSHTYLIAKCTTVRPIAKWKKQNARVRWQQPRRQAAGITSRVGCKQDFGCKRNETNCQRPRHTASGRPTKCSLLQMTDDDRRRYLVRQLDNNLFLSVAV